MRLPWAWAEFRIRGLPTDRYEIYEDPDSKVVVVLDRNTRDGTAFRANGASWELARRDFRRSTVLPDGGRMIPKIGWNEGHYEFPGYPNLAREIQRALKDCGSYPFLELFRKLGIENRILNPEAVAAGRLAYRADLEQYWTETSVSAIFQVYKYYPPDIAHAWFTIRRKLNP